MTEIISSRLPPAITRVSTAVVADGGRFTQSESPTPREAARSGDRSSAILNQLRRMLAVSDGENRTPGDGNADADQARLHQERLTAAFAGDALKRERQLGDALAAFQEPDAGTPPTELFASQLMGFEEKGPLMGQIEERVQRQLMEECDDQRVSQPDGPELKASSSDFLDDIFALMDRLDKEWLSRFSDILGNYVAFFNKLTDALALLKDSIKSTDKDGNLIVDFTKVRDALDDLQRQIYNGAGLGGDFKTEEEAKAFLDELGLGDLKVHQKSDGTWQLQVDRDVVYGLMDMFKKGEQKLSPAAHAALISAKDSLMERFNHINRVLPDKYQRQLQMWDTLVKTLSGTIDSMADTNKLILQNMA